MAMPIIFLLHDKAQLTVSQVVTEQYFRKDTHFHIVFN